MAKPLKRKKHKLVVTITHDNPVSAEAALGMFRSMFCDTRNGFLYYTTSGTREDTGHGYIVKADLADERKV